MRLMKLKRPLFFLWFCAALVFLPSGWAAEEAKLTPPSPIDTASPDAFENEYLLQPGDKVSVKIFPEDEYIKGGEMPVSSEGNITLSLVGKLNVSGKTIIEAERELAAILVKDYLVNPEVVIEVQRYKRQSFVVLGQVKGPGTYDAPEGIMHITLLQAISMAGGFSEIANIKKIKIVRKTGGQNQVIRANAEAIISGEEEDTVLEADDIIHVRESLF